MNFQKKGFNKVVSFVVIMVFILSMSFTFIAKDTLAAGTFTSVTAPDGRVYKLYVPSSYQSGTDVPLVVMLHGCTQDPDQFATGTEMNSYAEQNNFIVAYPQQPSSANSSKCWNFFEPTSQSRGSGEPKSIVGVVNDIKADYSIDDNRVYVAGLSAGAAMSVIMGATYPDVFAAICVGSGLEYKAATSMTAAFTAMGSAGGPNPETQGNLAYTAMGSYARVVPTIVFHGTSDYTVYPINGDQVISQWAQTNDRAFDGSDNNNIDDTADITENGQVQGGRAYTRYAYEDSTTGNIVLEKYKVTSMGHAWSGGNVSGSYTDPNGPKASQIMWDFFEANPIGGATDTTAPVTTASPVGGTFTNSVTVTLSVNENATTYYTTNGSTPTTSSAIYSAPLTFTSTTTLKYFSVDTASNSEAVKTQNYTVNTETDTTAPVTTASPAGGTFTDNVDVSLSANETATTYYTTDGSTPTTSSAIYSAPLTFTSTTTLKYFSVDIASNSEAVKTETYTISTETDTTAPVTTVSPAGGTFTDNVDVSLSANETATTYYTTDGSTPTTSSAIYSAPLTFASTTTLKYFSVDTAGNSEAVKTETYTINVSSATTFTSIATEDGYVGQYAADGYSTTVHKIGDKGMYNGNTYRTILSFDTSALNGATVTSAKLRIYRKSMTGTVTSIKADMKSGYFGTSSALLQTDYSATAGASDVVTLGVPTTDNGYIEVDLSSTARQYINTTGKTQFRLKGVTTIDFTSDVLEIYGGDDATYAPQLIVTTN